MSADHRHHLVLDSGQAAAGEASIWVRTLAAQHDLPQDWTDGLDLCSVEWVANIADYAYASGPGEIRLTLEIHAKQATLIVEDDGPAFDPLQQSALHVPASLDAAPIGGFGIHLVRQFASACYYERAGNVNHLEICFGETTRTPRRTDRRRNSAPAFPLVRGDNTWVASDERAGIDRRALGFISRTELFRNVAYGDLELIVADCKVVEYAAGEMVMAAGQHGHRVLVVIEGMLHVHLEGPESPDFLEIPCGECVGEISVADGKLSSAWVIAAGHCRLLEIDADIFLNRLLTIPSIGRNLISILAERMRRGNQRVIERVRMELELKSLHRELDFAQRIQSSMLPANPLLADEPRLDCQGYMRPARHIGGDFYDAFRIDENKFLLAIGDVCGKGMPAALFMAQTLAVLRGAAMRFLSHPQLELAALAAEGNNQLSRMNSEQLFVSVFVAVVDLAREEIRYVNAGHNAPVLVLPSQAPTLIEQPRNPIAGMIPGLAYRAGNLPFPAGSLLLLYTDGVTEAEAADGSQLGEAPLLNCISTGGSPAAALVDDIVNLVDGFSAGHPQADDITLLALYRH